MNRVFLLDVHHTQYLTIILKRMANFLTDLLRSFPILYCTAFRTLAFYATARVVSVAPGFPYLLTSVCSHYLLIFLP